MTLDNRTHALYRFYNATGQLLYVGITFDPGSRWRSHAQDKPWWHEVTRIELEAHPDRRAVLEAERNTIIGEKPRYNVIHNGAVRRSQPLPETFERAWARWSADMPDDCHNACVPAGFLNVYHPYFWHHGRAFYMCARGHKWVTAWPGIQSIGTVPENRGLRYMDEVTVPRPEQAR